MKYWRILTLYWDNCVGNTNLIDSKLLKVMQKEKIKLTIDKTVYKLSISTLNENRDIKHKNNVLNKLL